VLGVMRRVGMEVRWGEGGEGNDMWMMVWKWSGGGKGAFEVWVVGRTSN